MDSQAGSDSEAPDSAAQTGGNGGAPLSSRISIQKVCAIVGQFNDFKSGLVDEMGFSGMKRIHMLPKINLRFSSWLMQKLDADALRLEVSDSFAIELTDQSVHSVFSLPIGPKMVCQESSSFSEILARYTDEASSYGQKGVHSLKAAEVILLRPLNEGSSAMEVGCFQIAFAIFVVGHILAPTSKHDYVSLDFIGSLTDPSLITSFNWCGYVLKHLALAARKLQSDIARSVPSISIGGCHLYLQVLYIDHIDLGTLNKPRDITPLISLYDYESLRKMVDYISAANQEGSSFLPPSMNMKEGPPESGKPFIEGTPRTGHTCLGGMDHGPNETTKQVAAILKTPITHTPVYSDDLKNGPRQFSSLLKTKYPEHFASRIPVLLREHHARLSLFTNDFKKNCQEEMISFASKIMDATPAPCRCVNNSAKESCAPEGIAKPDRVSPGVLATPTKAPSNATPSTNLDCQEESSTGHSLLKSITEQRRSNSTRSRGSDASHGGTLKSLSDEGDARRTRLKKIAQPIFEPQTGEKPERPTGAIAESTFNIHTLLSDKADTQDSVADRTTKWSYDIVTGLLYAYLDYGIEPNTVTFGLEIDAPPTCLNVRPSRFGKDPWSTGSFGPAPSPTAAYAIVDWISRAPLSTLARNWVSHAQPRLLEIDGTYIRQQIIGSQPLSHEMCVLLVRRLCQIDVSSTKDAAGMQWRKFIEPDFSVYALANLDPMKLVSTHNIFNADASNFLVTSCRMYYLMAQLEDGWTAYGFDMQQKIIHVLDPVAGTQGFSNSRVEIHTICSTRLITQLFRTIKAFYDNWSCGTDGWQRRFPHLMTEDFRREDSGLCAIYLARLYDGTKLLKPLTKENLHMHRRISLYEAMRLEGNNSKMPSDVLEAIKTSFHVL